MLDINLIRNNPEIIVDSIKRRNKPNKLKILDDLLKGDKEFLKLKRQIEDLRHEKNVISQKINELLKQKKKPEKEIKQAKLLPKRIGDLEKKQEEIKSRIDIYLYQLPNILHKDVPSGKDQNDNIEIKKHGKTPKFNFELKNHAELLESLNYADFETARKTSGKGFNYLISKLAILDGSIQRYGVDFALKNGFQLVIPPIMLNKESIGSAINLDDFKDVVYKIDQEDLYLIGSAEHSLVAFFKDKILNKKDLPIKLCALTPCFRKEIGGHGVDMKGLFRMHQFNKVEQFCVAAPEDSYKILNDMQKITEKFFESLEIPYRVIEICSGDLGDKMARQYDIEAWFPRQNAYREVTSAGNATDYQARRINVKYYNGAEKKTPHMVNNTMVATSRTMVAILENYQQKDGSIMIPNVLQKYTGFKKID
ncbi:serine--tRNA ligase [Candidatus Woesearchaeota archaeon]|nr:serine--tRNA ligase [Candidatus Woesearchaeota archaeon]